MLNQEFIKKTLTDYQFYDATDEVIQLFPDQIQNAHYVSLIGSLQRFVLKNYVFRIGKESKSE